MTYEWRDHTAEVELVVHAATAEDVFREAADAFGRYVELDAGGAPATRAVELEGHDRATLLVALLDELIYFADTAGFVPDNASIDLTEEALRAEFTGRTTRVQPIVKAATYHDLEFRRLDDVWQARVVLDV